MNHWIDALSHFHLFPWFIMSHDQYKNNSGGEQIVPRSLHWLDEGASTGTVLTVFSLANWLGSLRSSQCLAVCVSLSSCSFLGLWRRRTSWVLHKNSFGYSKKNYRKKNKQQQQQHLHASKKTVDLIINVRNVSERWCSSVTEMGNRKLINVHHSSNFWTLRSVRSKSLGTTSDCAVVTHDHTFDFEASKAKNSSKSLFS